MASSPRARLEDLPVLGICGWSGSGKTTLLEAVLPGLLGQGLAVAAVKNDAHRIDVDCPGKDSDRLFRAGADVLLQGPNEEFGRRHLEESANAEDALAALCEAYDLVLVEGHKTLPVSKVWLLREGEDAAPPEAGEVLAALPPFAAGAPTDERAARLAGIVERWLPAQWRKTPVYGCVLIGGKSTRMGRPKHLLRGDGGTWIERTVKAIEGAVERVAIAGAGEVPDSLGDRVRLPDVADASGPMAGVLAAMRWAPGVSWLVAACDMPDLSPEALRWLLDQRRPGRWAVLPRTAPEAPVEPLLAYYDLRARPIVESLAGRGEFRLRRIVGNRGVVVAPVPAALAGAWRNVNTDAGLREEGR